MNWIWNKSALTGTKDGRWRRGGCGASRWSYEDALLDGHGAGKRPGPGGTPDPDAPAAEGADLVCADTSTTLCSGALETTTGPGSWGATRATSSSISRFDLPAACASSVSWFASVRCGTSRRNPVRCTRPELAASKRAGNRRPARATMIRSYAAASENRSSAMQNANIEE